MKKRLKVGDVVEFDEKDRQFFRLLDYEFVCLKRSIESLAFTSEQKRDKFWREVNKRYPQLEKFDLVHDRISNRIEIVGVK